VGIVVVVVVCVVVLATWITWTATRVDRLHTRTDAARASLDAQLVRRAAAVQALVDRAGAGLDPRVAGRMRTAARAALDADDTTRETAENDLGRALQELPVGVSDPDLMRDLRDAASRVVLARRFYNDAVRDTRSLRGRRMPRLLRLGGRRPLPAFFEIDDTAPPAT
jgi:Uncharacterized conserved protein